MKGTTAAAFVIMILMYVFLVPLSEVMGNENLHGVSLAVGQLSSWIFWAHVFAGIEYYILEIKSLYKEF